MLYKVAPCYWSWFKHTLVNDGYDYGKGAPYVLYNPPPWTGVAAKIFTHPVTGVGIDKL